MGTKTKKKNSNQAEAPAKLLNPQLIMDQIGIKVEEKDSGPATPAAAPAAAPETTSTKDLCLDDLYTKYKKLQQQLEFLAVQEEYIKDEQRNLKKEFVQKYLGEGPRMVRDVFRLAKENSPSIIFIDEIDAIATKRFDAQTSADREVQHILLELLNQMDGFDQTT